MRICQITALLFSLLCSLFAPFTFPIRTYIVCNLLFGRVYSGVLCHCGGHFEMSLTVYTCHVLFGVFLCTVRCFV